MVAQRSPKSFVEVQVLKPVPGGISNGILYVAKRGKSNCQKRLPDAAKNNPWSAFAVGL